MLLILWILVVLNVTFATRNLETVYEWKYIDYLWEANDQKEWYISRGEYDYKSIVPIDVDKAKDGRVFITMIRNNGVPVSLATVSNQMGPSGPRLKPYPNWFWYDKGTCDGITSVYRIAMDECNKLYVLDTGYIGNNRTCPAQVIIFDLGTDEMINRIKIPDSVSLNKFGVGKLVTPIIEVSGPNCSLENLFLADVNGHGLVIWNKERQLFRLEAKVFEPENEFTTVSIAGDTFELEDSLMGMAISSKHFEHEGRDLILRPFASRSLYTADTRVLARTTFGDTVKFKKSKYMLPSQATAMAISTNGTLFFGLTNEIAIGCWNRYRSMSPDNVVIAAEDKHRLQFTSGLKVLPSSRTKGPEEIWVLTNRLQKIMTDSINFNEVNFRVLKNSVSDLIKNSKCEAPFNFNGELLNQGRS